IIFADEPTGARDRISAMGSNLRLVRPGVPGQRTGGWEIKKTET
ncbi:hypothetical protein LCGC14_1184040, partial [marine sediment metagenome]